MRLSWEEDKYGKDLSCMVLYSFYNQGVIVDDLCMICGFLFISFAPSFEFLLVGK